MKVENVFYVSMAGALISVIIAGILMAIDEKFARYALVIPILTVIGLITWVIWINRKMKRNDAIRKQD